MSHLLVVTMIGLGGALGAMIRHLNALLVNHFWHHAFPLATFTINVIGSFIIGFLVSWLLPKTGDASLFKFFLITGFCGGYTTFSTFSIENLLLLQEGRFFTLFLYISSSIIISLLFTFSGLLLGRAIS